MEVADISELFAKGPKPKASELVKLAQGEGWKEVRTKGGPLKFVDKNGVVRMTLKRGSARTSGSESPHVEFRNPAGQRIGPSGERVTRKSPSNHTPIDYDLKSEGQ